MAFPTYRQQGLLIARGWPLLDMMCQCYSNARDRLKGRQLPVLYSSKRSLVLHDLRQSRHPVPPGGRLGDGLGLQGRHRIAAGWIGEGSTAEPDFHHALTFASVYRAPVILNVVNNQWAISSFQEIAGGEEATFAARAIGFGIACLGSTATISSLSTPRRVGRPSVHAPITAPTLIELFTYRAGPHSTSDDPTATDRRTNGRHGRSAIPIERLSRHLIGLGEWSAERHAQLESELADEVRDAGARGRNPRHVDNGPHFSAKTIFEDVFNRGVVQPIFHQEVMSARASRSVNTFP